MKNKDYTNDSIECKVQDVNRARVASNCGGTTHITSATAHIFNTKTWIPESRLLSAPPVMITILWTTSVPLKTWAGITLQSWTTSTEIQAASIKRTQFQCHWGNTRIIRVRTVCPRPFPRRTNATIRAPYTIILQLYLPSPSWKLDSWCLCPSISAMFNLFISRLDWT